MGRGAPDLVATPAPEAVAEGFALSDVVWTASGPDMVCEGRVVKRSTAVADLTGSTDESGAAAPADRAAEPGSAEARTEREG